MANVSFKKGLVSKLPATYVEGTFYVTTDERAIYLDVSNEARIRLGDFQEFATVEALTANTNPSATALYYVADINCLAKWDGSKYVQINRDTGMTSVEVTGEGNAVTAAVYDEAGRKLTLTKGATYMTAADVDSKISAKVGDIEGTVKKYVDDKTAGIATDASLAALTKRVDTAETDIDALETKVGAKSVGEQIDDKITALDLANTYDAKGAADGKDAAIAAAKKAGTDAQADVDALKAKVGTVPADKTVVKMIEEAQTAATYNDAAVKADIKKNADAIGVLNGSGEGSVDKKITDAFNDFATKVSDDGVVNSYKELIDWAATHGSEAAQMAGEITKIQAILKGIGGEGESATVVAYVTEAIKALKIGDYAKAADLTALAGRVTTAEASITTLTGEGAGSVKKAQADAEAHADTVAGTAETNAKKHATDLNTAMDTRVKKVEASVTTLTGEGEGSVKKALVDAKAYADGLAGNYDAKGDAAQALTDAKAYTDNALTWGAF